MASSGPSARARDRAGESANSASKALESKVPEANKTAWAGPAKTSKSTPDAKSCPSVKPVCEGS